MEKKHFQQFPCVVVFVSSAYVVLVTNVKVVSITCSKVLTASGLDADFVSSCYIFIWVAA